MGLNIRLAYLPQRSLAFGSIVAGYTGVGTSITEAVRIFEVFNLTDALLQFSLDGVDDHFVLPSNGYKIIDVTGNMVDRQGYYVAEGTRLYVKRIGVPTTGSVYLSCCYAAN